MSRLGPPVGNRAVRLRRAGDFTLCQTQHTAGKLFDPWASNLYHLQESNVCNRPMRQLKVLLSSTVDPYAYLLYTDMFLIR